MSRISVREASKIIGVSEQTMRLGLQQGVYPFGYAIKTSSKYTYVILKEKLMKEIEK